MNFKENEVANGIKCSKEVQNSSKFRRMYIEFDNGAHSDLCWVIGEC